MRLICQLTPTAGAHACLFNPLSCHPPPPRLHIRPTARLLWLAFRPTSQPAASPSSPKSRAEIAGPRRRRGGAMVVICMRAPVHHTPALLCEVLRSAIFDACFISSQAHLATSGLVKRLPRTLRASKTASTAAEKKERKASTLQTGGEANRKGDATCRPGAFAPSEWRAAGWQV